MIIHIRYADRLAEVDGDERKRPAWAALAEVYGVAARLAARGRVANAPNDILDIEARIDTALDRERKDGWLWLVSPTSETYPWCGNPLGRNADGTWRPGPRTSHKHGTLLLCFRDRTVILQEAP